MRQEILMTADMFELGDDVAIGESDSEATPYAFGIVTRVTAEHVTIRRPYMHHGGFKFSSSDDVVNGVNISGVGIIDYIGLSVHVMDRQKSGLHRVIRRVGELR